MERGEDYPDRSGLRRYLSTASVSVDPGWSLELMGEPATAMSVTVAPAVADRIRGDA
jgi:hypothetical protein